MKKNVYIFVVTVMTSTILACGNANTSDTKQREIDSTIVSEVVDTSMVDTTVAVRGGSESEGFGRCLESGCYCKEFKGRGQTCRNCGHAYKRHY